MNSISVYQFLVALMATMLVVDAIPMVGRDEAEQIVQKRLSNDALIRLLMRNRGTSAELGGLKRSGFKRSDLERRSIDDEFSNCFLSPVQCMLPSSRK